MILEEADGGTTKTKIMHKAFFELRATEGMPIGPYQNGLLEYIEGRQTFKTTANSLNFFEDTQRNRRAAANDGQKRLIMIFFRNMGLTGYYPAFIS
jgi:hypothetical protein